MSKSSARRRIARARRAGSILFVASLVVACGSRTGLLSTSESSIEEGTDSGPTGKKDASAIDGSTITEDASSEDVVTPPIDASLPDVQPPNDCPDADSTLVYLLGADNSLVSFFPPTLEFNSIGTLACPSQGSPYSMAVDRKGKAYSIFTDGHLFEVSTATAACTQATAYVPGQDGFTTFGMGFEGNATTENLFVVQESATTQGASKGLATIDTTTFVLSFVGAFSQELDECELTGTGDGRLFAFCVSADQTATGSRIVQIDPTNANVLAEDTLKVGSAEDAFAFAFWGNSFWIFTSAAGNSTVTQYNIDTATEATVAVAPIQVVGAGVSTCAPP